MQVGYCGNVHPGRTIEEVRQNLKTHGLDVKSQVCPDAQMGIGLWLSATAASELDDRVKLEAFRDWLSEVGLLPFTLNGFPFGDFHQAVVKHDVYSPTWADPSRLEYTVRLAEILNVLLPAGVDGTISTLPLGWPIDSTGKSNIEQQLFWESCSRNLRACAERLDEIAQSSGRNIMVCIEPEPGCVLDTCDDVVSFFAQHLLTSDTVSNELTRQRIGVCHDVCHSAVMFEEQAKAIGEYAEAGIRIGKVQISSAVTVDFNSGSDDERQGKREQLLAFAETRYLHQTSIRNGTEDAFYEDLSLALEAHEGLLQGQWRIHFHVPIFLESLGMIGTTQPDIKKCVQAIQRLGEPAPHFEIETYAWNVLPSRLKETSLANGIAKELTWFDELLRGTS